MSLVECPECNKEMSSTAPTCPHCGWVRRFEEAERKDISIGRILFALSLCLIIFLLALPYFDNSLVTANFGVKWEYKITPIKDENLEKEMDKMGKEGWEMISARRASGYGGEFSYEMIFKRKMREERK